MKTIMTTCAALAIFAAGWFGAQTIPSSSAAHLAGCQDCPDLMETAEHFGTGEGDSDFDPVYDLNHDGAVTIGDIVLAIICNYKE